MRAIRMFCFMVIAFVMTGPVLAEDKTIPEPGLRYRITGVAQNDQLNVRAEPRADAQIVGSLRPETGEIVVTGTQQVIGSTIWWELVYPGAEQKIGWVNSRFLTSDGSFDTEETNYPLNCIGTEPFWSLAIDGNIARYSSPDHDISTFEASPWVSAQGLRGQFVVRLSDKGAQGFAVVLRVYNLCTDNMSDALYPFHVTVIRPDAEVFGGCCHRAAL